MKQIIFIINSSEAQRPLKRITEFIENGYIVQAYAFSRELEQHTKPDMFEVKEIAHFPNTTSIVRRLKVMYKAIKNVYRENSNSDLIYYYFGLDVAIVARTIISNRYIYEESDLSHTYVKNIIIRRSLDLIDKYIIKRSIETVFTSEGFLKYHFGKHMPYNVSVITNRLNKNILKKQTNIISDKCFDIKEISIGFVGGARYDSVFNFVNFFSSTYPNHQFHFFGNPMTKIVEFEELIQRENVHFHGSFKNPDDLPLIYSQIDLVLSTYDIKFDNVRYAEPNKLYEAIYFNTPIIVSKNTFLEEKVLKLNIGFAINALDNASIKDFIDTLSESVIKEKVDSCRLIDKYKLINVNTDFFKKLESLL